MPNSYSNNSACVICRLGNNRYLCREISRIRWFCNPHRRATYMPDKIIFSLIRLFAYCRVVKAVKYVRTSAT